MAFRMPNLSGLPRPVRWGILFGLSALFSGLLTWMHLPAALLLGSMIASILIESGQAGLRVPDLLFSVAQGLIGCMVASAVTPSTLHAFAGQWPVFLTVVLAIIAFNAILGWAVSRFGFLPGTTAVWGFLPGAASAMMIMAESHGADVRLVAFIQYLRVVMVALVASLIGRFWTHFAGSAAPVAWFPALHWTPLLDTLAILLFGVAFGYASNVRAGTILATIFVGSALHAGGLVDLELPRWLLGAGFLCLGWRIGSRFTPDVLVHAMRTLPRVILSILTVIAFCGGLSVVLTKRLGVDPLTAYLATSPGGIDAAAVIASSTKVDMGFVMALQCARLLLVLAIGPPLSRFVADRVSPKSPP
jgi:membrane AbrB-like protein